MMIHSEGPLTVLGFGDIILNAILAMQTANSRSSSNVVCLDAHDYFCVLREDENSNFKYLTCSTITGLERLKSEQLFWKATGKYIPSTFKM